MDAATKLLMHPHTQTRLELYIKNPPQAILITGPKGSGKKTLAASMARRLLNLEARMNLEDYPYFLHIKRLKNKQEISIEDVRRLIKSQSLTTPGAGQVRNIILIEDSGYLSVPAQNALLKILEEPKADTVFILTVDSPLSLLPTIVSRTQQFDVKSVNLESAVEFWQTTKKKEEVENAWLLSQGNAGLLAALLSSDEEHSLKSAVKEAKKFLSLKTYDRVLMLDKVSTNRDEYLVFLEALRKIIVALHHIAIQKANQKQARRLLDARKIVFEAQEALTANTSNRLVSLHLLLNLKI